MCCNLFNSAKFCRCHFVCIAHICAYFVVSLITHHRGTQCILPSVTQDGGMVQRPPPIAVHLVDLGTILQEELAGRQGILMKEQKKHIGGY